MQETQRCGFNPWVRKSPGVQNGNALQYSCLKNSMDRGAWRATVHGVARSRTCATEHSHTQTHKCQEKNMLISHVWPFVPPWMTAHQAPLSVEFSRQEYWIILGNTSPGELSNPGSETGSPALQADSLLSAWAGKLAFNITEPFSKWATWRTFKSLCDHLCPDLFF